MTRVRGTFRIRFGSDLDLLLVALVPPLAWACAWLELPSIVRAPLGFAAVLVAPGAALCAALFPRRGALDGAERIASSTALSIALVTVYAPLCSATAWGLSLASAAVALCAWCIVNCLIAANRRRCGDERASGYSEPPTRGDRALLLTGSAVLAVCCLAAALLLLSSLPSTSRPTTEFYATGSGGALDQVLAGAGSRRRVRLGVVNHEQRSVDYEIVVESDGARIARLGPRSIAAGESWNEDLALDDGAGGRAEVSLALFAGGGVVPYRRLWLRPAESW